MTQAKRGSTRISKSAKPDISRSAIGHAVQSQVIPNLFSQLSQLPAAKEQGSNGLELFPFTGSADDAIRQMNEQGFDKPESANDSGPNAQIWTDNSNIGSVYAGVNPSANPVSYKHLSDHWMEADEFADIVLLNDESRAFDTVQRLQDDDVPDEAILIHLFAPTSLALGKRWELDTCDFADVTIGLCRLHRLVRSLHPTHLRTLDPAAHGGRILLAPAPGEQHVFGLLLVGELLFRQGWYTDVEISGNLLHITSLVKKNWYEMVGISLSCASRVPAAAKLISDIRSKSCNPNVAIIAGGRAFADGDEVGAALNVNGIARNGTDIAKVSAQFTPNQARV